MSTQSIYSIIASLLVVIVQYRTDIEQHGSKTVYSLHVQCLACVLVECNSNIFCVIDHVNNPLECCAIVPGGGLDCCKIKL